MKTDNISSCESVLQTGKDKSADVETFPVIMTT